MKELTLVTFILPSFASIYQIDFIHFPLVDTEYVSRKYPISLEMYLGRICTGFAYTKQHRSGSGWNISAHFYSMKSLPDKPEVRVCDRAGGRIGCTIVLAFTEAVRGVTND